MNIDFVTSADFFAIFIMLLALTFGITSMWIMHDLDKDDKKSTPKKTKLKKA